MTRIRNSLSSPTELGRSGATVAHRDDQGERSDAWRVEGGGAKRVKADPTAQGSWHQELQGREPRGGSPSAR